MNTWGHCRDLAPCEQEVTLCEMVGLRRRRKWRLRACWCTIGSVMIVRKSKAEIEKMRRSRIVADVHKMPATSSSR